jgi:hypothetical protein
MTMSLKDRRHGRRRNSSVRREIEKEEMQKNQMETMAAKFQAVFDTVNGLSGKMEVNASKLQQAVDEKLSKEITSRKVIFNSSSLR